MSSDRFSLREVAVPVAVVAIMVALTVPLVLDGAVSGSDVETAPGTVFNLSGCTGFAISESVLLTAKHCGITQDYPLISMTGERPSVVRIIDVPGMDAQAVVSDARNLVPFAIGPVRPGPGVTVYGYGRSHDESRSALVMHRAGLGAAHEVGGDGAFSIDVVPLADTVCEGDSGAPALQGDRVTGIVTGGDGPPCGTAVASAVAVQPAVDWLRRQGVV